MAAPRQALARLRPGCGDHARRAVGESLAVHQAAPGTIEKLRWLLAKATAVFGAVRLIDLRSE